MVKKRAPGGGRKPKGEFAGLAANLTIRMPNDMREQLNATASKSGRSLAQELLWRLRLSFRRDENKDRDPAMRALCFLIGEIAHQVAGVHVSGKDAKGQSREISLFNWRSDPFFYRAFKLAVQMILDELTPPGEISRPRITVRPEGTEFPEDRPLIDKYLNSFRTPEARAEYAASYVLDALRSAPMSDDKREERLKLLKEVDVPSFWREFYGMPDAARDLQPKERKLSGETFKLEATGGIPAGAVVIQRRKK